MKRKRGFESKGFWTAEWLGKCLGGGLWGGIAVFALFRSVSASACLTLADCQAAVPTAPSCCCLGSGWTNLPTPTPHYASEDVCLCSNGWASYCGPTPLPPATCSDAGFDFDTGGLCPGSRCTGLVLGSQKCVCKPGFYWDGDMCKSGPPPPSGNCTANPAPGTWNTHSCGTGAPNCADSPFPIPPPPSGTAFSDYANPMAVCCGVGWGENTGGASKLDCVEAVAPDSPTIETFLDFYNFNDTGPTKDLTTAGVPYPNQLFLLDSSGIPVNGFYTDQGERCSYRDATTKASIQVKASDQMAIFRQSLATLQIPAGPGGTANAEVDPRCCNLVVLALERRCPENDQIPSPGTRLAVTDSGVRRCTAAKAMKIDFGLFDFCDPSVTHRPRFRVATSFSSDDPNRASLYPNDPINVDNLISEFYPSLIPLLKPVCPDSPAVYEVPWTGGRCRLKAFEPPYPYPPT